MRSRRVGLSVKFVLIIAAFLTVLFVIFSFVLVRLNVRLLSNNLNQETRSFTQLSSQPIGDSFLSYQDSGRIRIAQEIQRFIDLDPNITNVSIIDTLGALQFSQFDNDSDSVSSEQASSFVPVFVTNSRGNIERAIVPHLEDSGVHRYSVVYDVSDESIEQATNRQVQLVAVFAAIGLLLSMLAMYVLVDINFLQPIKTLSQQALSISQGNIHMKIAIDRHDEVSDLAGALNQMAASLQADIRKLQELDELKSEFLTIVSHNLRTPLTIIRGYLDNADEVKSIDDMQEILDKLKYGSDRLNRFAEDMIMIAELESGQSLGNRQEMDLQELLLQLTADYKHQANHKNITYSEEIENSGRAVNVNASLLGGAITNLLDNALKFTKAGGRINLKYWTDDKLAHIKIVDDGIGISKDELPKLFTKFHRGTSTLTYDYEGTGIGLYASSLIIKQHGGTISATSQLGRGSTFTVTLPLA